MIEKPAFLPLIEDYLRAAEECVLAMRREFGFNDLLAAVNGNLLPRRGRLKSMAGGTYRFHGIGCRVNSRKVKIDFDFGVENSIDGFDPHKLYEFARERRRLYPWLPDRTEFIRHLEELVSVGTLRQMDERFRPNMLKPSR